MAVSAEVSRGSRPEGGRAEAVAAIAGGLAHDLSNLLSAVVMMVDLLVESRTQDRERSVLLAIEDSARRGVTLVRQLLWLARGVEEETALFQPKYLLTDLQRMAESVFPASVAIRSQLPADLWLIRGNSLAVYRLLLDLCLDARAELTAGSMGQADGELRLTAWNESLEEVAAAVRSGAATGPYVVAEVSSSIGAVTLRADAAAAAESWGGFCEVVPREGSGLAFRLYLPAVPAPGEEAASRSTAAPEGRGQLLLLVDGDDAVRAAMAGTLEKHGYRAETAADGAEAVALFARDSGTVAAVVAAADLRYLDGRGVVRAVRRLRAGAPAILTGGADLAAGAGDLGAPAPVVLAKPFGAAELLAAVHGALRSEGPHLPDPPLP